MIVLGTAEIAGIAAKLTVHLARRRVPSSFVRKGDQPLSSSPVFISATREEH